MLTDQITQSINVYLAEFLTEQVHLSHLRLFFFDGGAQFFGCLRI